MRDVRLIGPVAVLAAVGFSACFGGDDEKPHGDGSVLLDAGFDADAAVEDSATDGGDGAVDAGDAGGGGGCQSAECDLLTGGCETDGGACYYISPAAEEDPVAMCDVAGTLGNGETCANYDDCADGFGCMGANPATSTTGTCRKYCCDEDSTDCPTSTLCTVSIGDGVGYCAGCDDCDLIAQTGCDTPKKCYVSNPEAGCAICIATTAAALTEGQVCTYSNDCVGGLGCFGIGPGTPSQCYKFCTVGAAEGCGTGQTCIPLNPSGFENVGVCNPLAT